MNAVGAAVAANGPDSVIWWDWVGRHRGEIATRALEHLEQTGIAVGVGFAISLALAAIALRVRWTTRPITALAAILYTLPSLALFAILIPITGLTLLTAEIALVSYTLILLIPNIVGGVENIPREVIDAADAMGMSRRRRFWRVEAPLAIPQTIAGLRVATVSTIGLVTISSFVGLGGGFGALISDGRQRAFSTPMVIGVLGSILLAIAFDTMFVIVGWVLTPWRRQSK